MENTTFNGNTVVENDGMSSKRSKYVPNNLFLNIFSLFLFIWSHRLGYLDDKYNLDNNYGKKDL